MKKSQLLLVLSFLFLLGSFTVLKNGRFSIKAHITGFNEGTTVYLVDGDTNEAKDSAYIKNDRFEFFGETSDEPQNFVLYIPLEKEAKYSYIFMADEDVTVEGKKEDFPNNLIVKGSVHQSIKTNYDTRIANYNLQMGEKQKEMQDLKQQKKWNDSLQRAYIGENGILPKMDSQKTEEEKRFIAEHLNTYYGLQILYYKKSYYTDKQLKKIFSKFSKKLQASENGKAIQTYLNSPAIKKGDSYVDFQAVDKTGNAKKLSEAFDGKKYVLVDFSTPTCPNSKAALPMLKYFNKEHSANLNIVTFYTENKKEHFDYLAKLETPNWSFLWTEKGNNGFPYTRYRINSTPTYYLFSPDGKLIETWSGFQQGYSDATQPKIEKLIGRKQ